MIDPYKVTAVIVTKGDVDTVPLRTELGKLFRQVLVWDNSEGNVDRKVYGRYIAADLASTEYAYTQDDDCNVDARRLCAEYQPDELLCNVIETHREFYAATRGVQLVGWGAIFPKSMIDFAPYLAKYSEDDLFDRECDRVFTFLNRAKTRVIDIGVEHLPCAHGMDRMSNERGHGYDFYEIRRRLATLST